MGTTNSLGGFGNVTIDKTVGGLGTTNLFGTSLKYGTDSNLQLQGTTNQTQTTFFGSLLEKFGLGGLTKTDTITPQGGKNDSHKFEFKADKTEVHNGDKVTFT
jgi:hypothetical protein